MTTIRIISGGQTGVDRAALDFALENKLPCGGWCPKGRKAEDGIIDARYPLRETQSEEYDERSEMNVLHSDGTLILNKGTALSGGTKFTFELAATNHKPCLVINLDSDSQDSKNRLQKWIKQNGIEVMNVAGQRESNRIYRQALEFLRVALKD